MYAKRVLSNVWYSIGSPSCCRYANLGLNIVLVLDLNIRGLLSMHHASTAISNLPCPIQLPTSV